MRLPRFNNRCQDFAAVAGSYARHVVRLTEFTVYRTEPSHSSKLTPLGCALLAVVAMRPPGYMHDRELGSPTWK